MIVHITKDFTLQEMVESPTARAHHIRNYPGQNEMQAIEGLVKRLLQPLRIAYGRAIRITSGYRCPELNKLVGGKPASQHIKGEAADCVVENPRELLEILLDCYMPYDQVIYYREKNFLHLSLRSDGGKNRRQIMILP